MRSLALAVGGRVVSTYLPKYLVSNQGQQTAGRLDQCCNSRDGMPCTTPSFLWPRSGTTSRVAPNWHRPSSAEQHMGCPGMLFQELQ